MSIIPKTKLRMKRISTSPPPGSVNHSLLSALLVLCILLAWPVNSTQAETLDIVYTHENPAFSELLKTFAKQSNHKVMTTWVDQSDLKSRMVDLDNIRDVPDVIITPADSLGMSGTRWLMTIPDNWMNAEYSSKVLETVTIDQQILGLPIVQGNHLLLYYNKSLAPEGAATWQQLMAYADQLPAGTQLIRWSFMEMYWFIPFITAFGELPVVDHEPNLDTSAMKAALNFNWQLASQGLVDRSCDYTCADYQFKNGQLAFTINGIWAYESFAETLGDDFGVMALPAINNQPMRPYFSTIVATFPKANMSDSKREALEAFAGFIQSNDFQQQLWLDMREIPAVESVLMAIRASADAETQNLLSTLETTVPMSSHENMTIIWEVILKGYLRYGSGIWNAERSTTYMQQLAKQHISRLAEKK